MSLKLMSLALFATIFALSLWACSVAVRQAHTDSTMRLVIAVVLALHMTDGITDILEWLTV